MNETYGRDVDLNLLRVLVAVADHGTVTSAASALYLTQPAISASLKRLTRAVGAPLFVRQGRGIVLNARGARLVAEARPHLSALVDAVLDPRTFDPLTSDRIFRIGMADALEGWLLPYLLRLLAREAPHMRIIVLPTQFRTVGDMLATRRIDLAITVADELPTSIRRRQLLFGGFVCLYDPRHARIGKRLSEREYFAHEHVIVSYNGDLRGVVEDLFGKTRNVRCSTYSFSSIGALVEGSALLATVPRLVAEEVRKTRPRLAIRDVPLKHTGGSSDMLWPVAEDDDPASIFLRERIVRSVAALTRESRPRKNSA